MALMILLVMTDPTLILFKITRSHLSRKDNLSNVNEEQGPCHTHLDASKESCIAPIVDVTA